MVSFSGKEDPRNRNPHSGIGLVYVGVIITELFLATFRVCFVYSRLGDCFLYICCIVFSSITFSGIYCQRSYNVTKNWGPSCRRRLYLVSNLSLFLLEKLSKATTPLPPPKFQSSLLNFQIRNLQSLKSMIQNQTAKLWYILPLTRLIATSGNISNPSISCSGNYHGLYSYFFCNIAR